MKAMSFMCTMNHTADAAFAPAYQSATMTEKPAVSLDTAAAAVSFLLRGLLMDLRPLLARVGMSPMARL